MNHPFFCIAILFVSATNLSAQVAPGVASGKVTEYADRDAQENDAIGDEYAPSADDSDKWYITLLTRNRCAHCERMRRDFAEDPNLKAFVDTADHKNSWANWNVCSMDDPTQASRFKPPQSNLKIKGFPTLLVQPPSNGKYGPSQTIVFQKTGYDGNPRKLAQQLSEAINHHAAEAKGRTGATSNTIARRTSKPTR